MVYKDEENVGDLMRKQTTEYWENSPSVSFVCGVREHDGDPIVSWREHRRQENFRGTALA